FVQKEAAYRESSVERMAPKKAVRAVATADVELGPDEGAILPEDATGATGQVAGEESVGDVLELKRMFQRFMRDQQDRDARQAQEVARQETRWKSLQHQFHLLQGEVSQRISLEDVPGRGAAEPDESPRAAMGSRNTSHGYVLKEPKIQPLCETDDIEHYLTTFERIAEVCRWPREDWAIRLVPLLTGKARSAYVAMDVADAGEYAQVKEAILKKYSINHETYRQRFRDMEVLEEETPKELYVRLKDLYQKWVKPAESTIQDIGEAIILEQFLRMLSPELQTWIKEHDPSTAEEAARLADVFVAARRRAEPWSFIRWKTARDRSSRRPGSASYGGRSSNEASVNRTENSSASVVETIRCYKCGQLGHKKPMCPQLTRTLTNVCYVPRETKPEPANLSVPNQMIRTVEVNGEKVTALIDTGCTQTLVDSKLVPGLGASSDAPVIVRCVHGEERQYAVTDVYMGIAGQTYLMRVGLAHDLPYSVILGHDFPALMELLPVRNACNIVLTRAQSKQSEGDEEENTLLSLPFFDSELSESQGKIKKSRRERKQEKFKRMVLTRDTKEPERLLNADQIPIPEDLRQLQKEEC
ncbi:MAG: retroviral-like aspartic protease family protein, partial [Plesiomonas sp.]